MINETADYDKNVYKNAQNIISHIHRYLYNSEYNGFNAIRIKRKGKMVNMLTVSGSVIGLDGEEEKLLFGFDLLEGYYPSGFYGKMTSGNKIIVVHCLDETDMEYSELAAKKIIHSSNIYAVLIHEITHYFDSKRNNTMFTNPVNVENNGSEKYFNDPSEYNAFFNNIAHPLLSFLTITDNCDINMIKRMARGMKISTDFKKNLELCIKNNRWLDTNEYMKHLNKRNKEALIKRLYKIHTEVVNRLNHTEKQPYKAL